MTVIFVKVDFIALSNSEIVVVDNIINENNNM
jgi:hypothetical protein